MQFLTISGQRLRPSLTNTKAHLLFEGLEVQLSSQSVVIEEKGVTAEGQKGNPLSWLDWWERCIFYSFVKAENGWRRENCINSFPRTRWNVSVGVLPGNLECKRLTAESKGSFAILPEVRTQLQKRKRQSNLGIAQPTPTDCSLFFARSFFLLHFSLHALLSSFRIPLFAGKNCLSRMYKFLNGNLKQPS